MYTTGRFPGRQKGPSVEQYHIQRQDRTQPGLPWEPIESGWECDNHFTEVSLADAAARTLALRHDGAIAFRVVGASGQVMMTIVVEKCLRVASYSSSLKGVSEHIPPGFDVPMLSDVLADDTKRARVFFRTRKVRVPV